MRHGRSSLSRADDLLVQRLAHAVQALELVLAGIEVLAGHGVDGGERQRIVRGELRERRIGRRQQPARAGEVRHVGVDAPREHRIVLQAVELGALDLAVPVGALDQAHHQPAMRAAREIDQPVDREQRALLVGLHDEADAVPAFELGLEAEPLQQIERDFQPVGFLGVDVQPDVVVAREHGQFLEARIELGLHPLDLRAAVARMQRRQLDRDARPFVDAAVPGRAADRVDGRR